MKYKFFLIFVLILVYYTNNNAQGIMKPEKTIDIGLEDVVDIKIVADQYVLLTNDNTLHFFDREKEIEQKPVKEKKLGFGNNVKSTGFDINKETGDIDYIDSKFNVKLSDEQFNLKKSFKLSDKNSLKTNFLTKFDDKYFTAVQVGIEGKTENSWSNQLIMIDQNGKVKKIARPIGLPAGLYNYNNKLYYLGKKSEEYPKGFIVIYNSITTKMIDFFEISVNNPTGITVNKDNIIVYSNDSKKIYIFNKENQ